jgi:hypothetical protein
VVAQDHDALVAQVGEQALALLHVEGHALVVVICHLVVDQQRVLRKRQQAFVLRRYAAAVARVQVDHAFELGPCGVDAAVDDEAGRVDDVVGIAQQLAVLVDLDQARGGDLLEHHPVGVEQELVVGAGDARREVVADQVGPAEQRHQPVGRGEVQAYLPFGLGHARRGARQRGRREGVGPRRLKDGSACVHVDRLLLKDVKIDGRRRGPARRLGTSLPRAAAGALRGAHLGAPFAAVAASICCGV